MLDYISLDGSLVSWLVGSAMYAFQTNQIEAAMNNQSNCRFQSYLLTSAKLASAKWRKKEFFRVVSPRVLITGINTMMQYSFFLRKGVLKMDFTVKRRTEIT